MNIRVTVRGLKDRAQERSFAEERITAALSRFADRIQSVAILLEDVTGTHKQGIDKRCRIGVHLRSGSEVMIDELGPDIRAALLLAVDRLKAAMSRNAGRGKRGVGAG